MDELIRLESVRSPLQIITWIVLLILALSAVYYIINIGNRYIERSKRIVIDSNLVKKIIIGILSLIIVTVLLRKFPIIGRVLAAGFIAAILAYIINPLVEKLEKRKINRIFGVIIVYLTIIVIISILMVVVVPKTAQEIKNLVSSLPSIIENVTSIFTNLIDRLTFLDGIPGTESLSKTMEESYNNVIKDFMTWVTTSASKITVLLTHFIQNFIGVLLTLVLILIMTFYFLVDKEKYVSKIRSLIPNSLNSDISYLADRINTVLTEFIRGRIILAIFVGVFTAILLLILGVDFAIVIGVITLIADIIPYVGPLLGFIPAFLFALIEAPYKALIVAIFYVLIQWAENNLLAPKIIGDSMGLNPLFIFLAIVIGGGMFGVWGMVVSVPLAAIGLILIEFARTKYIEIKEKNKKDGTKAQ